MFIGIHSSKNKLKKMVINYSVPGHMTHKSHLHTRVIDCKTPQASRGKRQLFGFLSCSSCTTASNKPFPFFNFSFFYLSLRLTLHMKKRLRKFSMIFHYEISNDSSDEKFCCFVFKFGLPHFQDMPQILYEKNS